MTIGPVMLDLVGTELLQEDIERLRHPASGGIILFSRNYDNPQQLKTLIADVRRVVDRPFMIAVDHEGGRVQRFREGFTRIPPMAWLGSLFDSNSADAIRAARELGWLLAAELRAYDIDISFAPVLDLGLGLCDVIGDRSFHRDPQAVIQLAGSLIAGMHDAGMATTGKHFPGHGAVTEDSHVALPVDHRSFADIESADIQPFMQLANAGMDAVMPAHVIYENCDSNPAGFSSFWLQEVLRDTIGFDGVIFSDDLTMEGAAQAGSYPQRARAAFDAGCDMVLVCNNQAAAQEVLDAVVMPVSEISSKRLERMLGSAGDSDLGGSRWQQASQLAASGVQWAEEVC